MDKSYTGGCACGAVRYEIAAEPIMSGHCQCRDCQRASGAGHGSFMAFPEAAVRMTGKPRFHDAKADSGGTVSRGFCPECGSPVIGKTSGFPGMMIVTAGSLDDPARFKPQFVVYTSSGHAWDHMDAKLPAFAKLPPPEATPAAGR
jgi:hypothetical protein